MERWGHQGDYHSAHEGKVFDYSTNLCTSSHVWSCGDLGYTCCQYTRDTFNFQANMGFWSGGQPVWELINAADPHSGLILTFTNGDPCKIDAGGGHFTLKKRITHFVLACDPNGPEIPGDFHSTEDFQNCVFTFGMPPSRHACPIPEPTFPHTTLNYRATLEITIPDWHETMWLHEIHDTRKQRIRNDQYFHPGGFVTTLITFDTHARYNIINGTRCTMQHLPPSNVMHSVFDMLREHRDRLVYQGNFHQRGVNCDMWEGHWVATTDDGITYFEDAIWFFAQPQFRVVENPDLHRRPVMVFLRTNLSRAHVRTPDMHVINFLEYNDNLDARSEREVDLQPEWNCPGGPPMPPRPTDGSGGMDDGSVAGLSIFMLALGGAFGVGGFWYYQKRKSGYHNITHGTSGATYM